MQVEPPPSAELVQAACPKTASSSIFQQIKPLVADIVEIDIQHHILMRKHNKGIKKDPPSQQHQKIQQIKMNAAFLFQQVGTPGYRPDHRHRVKEKNDVEEREIGNLADAERCRDKPKRPDCTPTGRIRTPSTPRNCAPAPDGQSIAQRDPGGGQHQRQADEIGKCGQPGTFVGKSADTPAKARVTPAAAANQRSRRNRLIRLNSMAPIRHSEDRHEVPLGYFRHTPGAFSARSRFGLLHQVRSGIQATLPASKDVLESLKGLSSHPSPGDLPWHFP